MQVCTVCFHGHGLAIAAAASTCFDKCETRRNEVPRRVDFRRGRGKFQGFADTLRTELFLRGTGNYCALAPSFRCITTSGKHVAKVMDHDKFSADDLCGSCTVKVSDL